MKDRLIAVVLAILLGMAMIFLINEHYADKEKLMAECMADGKKEYECVGLLE